MTKNNKQHSTTKKGAKTSMLRHTIYRLATIRSLRYITTVIYIQSLIPPLGGAANKVHYGNVEVEYCWFSHDVTKIQTTKLSILVRLHFHGVLEQLETNFQTNFRFKTVLDFVIEYT